MSTTVKYKGSTIATLNNQTKTLTTAGTWVEGNIEIISNDSGEAIVVADISNSTGTTCQITGNTDIYADYSSALIALGVS